MNPPLPPVLLVRAVTPPEQFAVHGENGFSPSPNGCEVKYFTLNLHDASSFARLLFQCRPTEGPLTAANGRVDYAHFDKNWLMFVDGGLPAIAIPITKLHCIAFLGFEPILHVV